MRVVTVRTGVVLDRSGGALAKMLPPFRLGVGGPVAGGRQYISWIHVDDLVGLMLAALDGEEWSGPINATAPEPVTNAEFSRALGRALGRPALLPVPGLALRRSTARWPRSSRPARASCPAKPLVLGYEFRHPRARRGAALGARRRTSSGELRAPAHSAAVRPPPAPARRAGAPGSRSR